MSEKSVHIATFSGKGNDWRQWSEKILEVTEKREYCTILETVSEEISLKAKERKKINCLAYSNLLLAMIDNISFGLLNGPNSTNYPNRDVRTILGEIDIVL